MECVYDIVNNSCDEKNSLSFEHSPTISVTHLGHKFMTFIPFSSKDFPHPPPTQRDYHTLKVRQIP